MVQTRRSYRHWVDTRGDGYRTSQSQESCEACSQRSSDAGYDFGGGSQASIALSEVPGGYDYRPNDRCKRHRRPDDSPYVTSVVSYRRRKPRV